MVGQGGITQALWDESANAIHWNLTSNGSNYRVTLNKIPWANDFTVGQELLESSDGIHILRQPDKAQIRNDEGEALTVSMDRIPPTQTLLSVSTNLADIQTWLFRANIEYWNLHHDLRVDRFSSIRQAAVARVETRIAADGQNLIPALHTLYTDNRDFKYTLDAAMRAAFGSEYEDLLFPPAADQRVQLRLRWRSLRSSQSAANLSDGTLRFLLLIAILANPTDEGLIAIDEPEAGLHPNMLPIIAELAAEASEKSQVIFTTHSPQFLDAFRGVTPTTTVTQWLAGETRLSIVDGDELKRWLEHYSLGDVFLSGELEAMT
jgi:predicted ATPase